MLTFRIGICRIRLHFSCFALLAFCCIFTGIGSGASCLGAVVVHETSHLAAMVLLGDKVSEASLSALGLRVISDKGSSLSDTGQAVVSLAGPASNWLCWGAAIFLGFGNTSFANVSLALGLVHSLPVEPLDGGLALRYFLRRMAGEQEAERISRGVSVVLLFPLAVLGFLLLLHTKYNYTLLLLSMYLMLYLVFGWDYTQP